MPNNEVHDKKAFFMPNHFK